MRYLLLICSVLLTLPLAAQIVYKTVDEDGNITYTDQPPDDQAEPMELPPISVVKAQPASPSKPKDDDPVKKRNPADTYGDLRMLEPIPDRTYAGTGGTMVFRLQADHKLAAGHKVNYYIDGRLMSSTRSMMQLFSDVVRGEHQARAEIVDAKNKVLVISSSVTFHMQQPSVLNRANRGGSSGRRGN